MGGCQPSVKAPPSPLSLKLCGWELMGGVSKKKGGWGGGGRWEGERHARPRILDCCLTAPTSLDHPTIPAAARGLCRHRLVADRQGSPMNMRSKRGRGGGGAEPPTMPRGEGGQVGAPPHVTPPPPPPPRRPQLHDTAAATIRAATDANLYVGGPHLGEWLRAPGVRCGAGGPGGASLSASTGQAGRIPPHPPRLA